MLKPPVLRFTDDIPEAQFWFGADVSESGNMDALLKKDGVIHGKVFRVPANGPALLSGYTAAWLRCRGELGMEKPVLAPANPRQILQWLKAHPEESKFRVV